ncbi:hypothetical protein ACWC09_39605 [Streptomyces sp. NPDC001617]
MPDGDAMETGVGPAPAEGEQPGQALGDGVVQDGVAREIDSAAKAESRVGGRVAVRAVRKSSTDSRRPNSPARVVDSPGAGSRPE